MLPYPTGCHCMGSQKSSSGPGRAPPAIEQNEGNAPCTSLCCGVPSPALLYPQPGARLHSALGKHGWESCSQVGRTPLLHTNGSSGPERLHSTWCTFFTAQQAMSLVMACRKGSTFQLTPQAHYVSKASSAMSCSAQMPSRI